MEIHDKPTPTQVEEMAEFGAPFEWFEGAPDHNAYAEAVRRWTYNCVGSNAPNAVFMDTTTIHTALSLLLEAGPKYLTPMTLLDLANATSAIITHDTIFHLENTHLDSASFNEILDNKQVFVPIPVSSADRALGNAVGSLIIGHWRHSRRYITRLSHPNTPYANDALQVKKAWETILNFPIVWIGWQQDTMEFVNRYYGEESEPPKFLREATDLFRAGTFADRKPVVSESRVGDFVHECNLRSLFNWSIAYALRLSYLPNTFRLPFQQLLYSNGEAARQYLIHYLDKSFLEKSQALLTIDDQLHLPLFLSAILAKAETLRNVRDLLTECRFKATEFRKRRAELNDAIEQGNYKQCKRLMKAIETEETPKLWRLAAGAAGVFTLGWIGAAIHDAHPFTLHLLAVPGALFAVEGVAAAAHPYLEHLFHPRFRFVSTVSESATDMINLRGKVSSIWNARLNSEFDSVMASLRQLKY